MGYDDAVDRLVALGITPDRSSLLADIHGRDRVRDVIDAADSRRVRNRAGWTIQALTDDWDLGPGVPDDHGRARRRAARRAADTRRRLDDVDDRTPSRCHAAGWATALDGALDDRLLSEAITALTARLPSAAQRSVPIVRAHLLALAAEAHAAWPDRSLRAALRCPLPSTGGALASTGGRALPPSPPGRSSGTRPAWLPGSPPRSCSGRSDPPPQHTTTGHERTQS